MASRLRQRNPVTIEPPAEAAPPSTPNATGGVELRKLGEGFGEKLDGYLREARKRTFKQPDVPQVWQGQYAKLLHFLEPMGVMLPER
ncbi:MAG: hypothetical protein V1703_04950 [Candidatus Altiarchaeota archaeon]